MAYLFIVFVFCFFTFMFIVHVAVVVAVALSVAIAVAISVVIVQFLEINITSTMIKDFNSLNQFEKMLKQLKKKKNEAKTKQNKNFTTRICVAWRKKIRFYFYAASNIATIYTVWYGMVCTCDD